MTWKTCKKFDAHVHVLPDERAAQFLGSEGPDRLIFGTDFPDGEYEVYLDILDRMDFTDEEIDQIAWKNIEKLLTPGKDGQ